MGIFGAMTTAITGLRAQSFSLERISDNIANSQTVAYKRSDVSFADFVPDSPATQQALGVVNAYSRPTNTIQGDITNESVETYMAINGDGYFIVGEASNTVDGLPVIDAENLYTRRGDFEFDRNGYLVNSAGYYLKGLPVDSVTGNTTGSVPDIIRVTNDFIPASATTRIDYRANLASYPRTGDADAAIPNSELLVASSYSNDPTTNGTATGDGVITANDATTFIADSVSGGSVTTFDSTGNAVDVQLRWAKIGNSSVPATQTGGAIGNVADLGAGIAGFDDALGTNDLFRLTAGGADYDFTIGTGVGEVNTLADLVTAINGTATLSNLVTASAQGTSLQIVGDDVSTAFTVAGDAAAITGLGMTAGAVNPATTGGADTWNLFYLSDSTATGTDTAWTNIGQSYSFGTDSQLNPAVTNLTVNNLTVNGNNLGNILLNHGSSGITQFADSAGIAKVTEVNQDGFAAGELTGVTVSQDSRIVATYTNGRTVDLAEVVLASFNGDNGLAKTSGGAFRETTESGSPILGAFGAVVGSALEGSNTDIADEFSKLIVTQQAYAANTRVISTAEEMLQEALNIVR